jgi:glycosyltransferase involved in cell wall biosynthesis
MGCKVSVIVPVYNVEKCLPKCIETIIGQTFLDIEIILIDDGSTDSSGEICESYKKRDSRITAIHKPNGGLSSARNAGLEIACGEYVSFIDSDDYIEPDMYEIMYEKAIEAKADIVTCNVRAFKPEGIKERVMYMRDELRDFSDPNYFVFYDIFGKQASIFACNSLYKMEIIKKYNLFFLATELVFSEDQLFNLCYYAAVRRACYIDKPLYNYVIRTGSLSRREPVKGILNMRVTLVMILKDFIDSNGFKKQPASFYAFLMWQYFVNGCGTISNKERLISEIKLIEANKKFFNSCLRKLLFGKAGRTIAKINGLKLKASVHFRLMLVLLLLGKYEKPAQAYMGEK